MAVTTHVFAIEGMHCGSCALLIDDTLQDLPGVHTTETSAKNRRSRVELDLERSSPNDVVRTIEELGYRATPAS